MYSCCISLTQWMCILLLSEVLAKQSGPFLEFIFLFSPSSHRFSSRLFAPKHPLRTVLCPCFPFPLIKMNPGNIFRVYFFDCKVFLLIISSTNSKYSQNSNNKCILVLRLRGLFMFLGKNFSNFERFYNEGLLL